MTMSSDPEDDGDASDQNEELLDPRIRDKLEELNKCTENINKLEKYFEVFVECYNLVIN